MLSSLRPPRSLLPRAFGPIFNFSYGILNRDGGMTQDFARVASGDRWVMKGAVLFYHLFLPPFNLRLATFVAWLLVGNTSRG